MLHNACCVGYWKAGGAMSAGGGIGRKIALIISNNL